MVETSLLNTLNMFMYNQSLNVPNFQESTKIKLKVKANDLYKTSLDHLINKQPDQNKKEVEIVTEEEDNMAQPAQTKISKIIDTFS